MIRTTLALMVAIAGCADGAIGDGSDPEPGEPREPMPPESPPAPSDLDYTNSEWELANVSQTPQTISHHGRLALAQGHAVVAFSEPLADDYGDQDIHRAVRVGDSWQSNSMTVGESSQLAFPNVVAAGDALWYAYTGPGAVPAEGASDIWLRREPVGQSPTPAINVTEAAAPQRRNNRSQTVATSDGVGILFVSQPLLGDETPTDIRAIHVDAAGTIGAPTTVFVPEGFCTDLVATSDAAGAIHAVADCNGLTYITNASGSFEAIAVPLGTTRAPNSPDIAIDALGSVHIAWSGTLDCDDGLCRRVQYSRDLGEPVSAAIENGYMPEVAVDASNRVLIAYHRTGTAPAVMITHSVDGQVFQPPRRVATSKDRDTSATDLQFDTGGWPHLLFQRVLSNTSPLDAEIMLATIR